MLSAESDPHSGEVSRLFVHTGPRPAWIARWPRAQPGEGRNWRLWVQRRPELPATTGKSPVRLLTESRLRGWLLQRYHRCLFTLSFAELCQIAERERQASRAGVSDV